MTAAAPSSSSPIKYETAAIPSVTIRSKISDIGFLELNSARAQRPSLYTAKNRVLSFRKFTAPASGVSPQRVFAREEKRSWQFQRWRCAAAGECAVRDNSGRQAR